MFDDQDRISPEEQPKQQPKPDTSTQKEYEGGQRQGVEKAEGDRLDGTDPNQN